MGYNGSGTFTATASSFNPAVAATTISATDWNTLLDELEAALSAVICKDGQTTTTARVPFAAGMSVDSGQKIWPDGGGDTYLIESSANVLDIYTGGALRFRTADFGTNIAWIQREGSYTPGDVTPSVLGVSWLSVTNSGATTIPQLDDGSNGQVVTLFFNDSNTTINRDHALLAGGSNFTGTASDTLTLRYISASDVWVELCRSVNA
jgi:hypothetical protein